MGQSHVKLASLKQAQEDHNLSVSKRRSKSSNTQFGLQIYESSSA